MPKKDREDIREQGAPAWMVTYSDLMTLLLVFFVLIYSFSVLDVQKFKAFIASFPGVGVLDKGTAPLDWEQKFAEGNTPGVEENLPRPESRLDPLVGVYALIQQYLQEKGLEEDVLATYEDRGIALDIKERILFDSGKADLKPEAKEFLDGLAGLLSKLPNQISVEGHTDNRPINTVEFPSNWELSAARASRVVRYFTEKHNLDPRKFVVVGFGEYHPVAPNDTPENQAQNRRVVIVINAKNIYETGVYLNESRAEERQ
ncbi:OmpA family protein [Calderihabitans maritimus]|uniref:Flagellar motor protein n=1 Tax=Calderihabitans maritimus TaxID=1246530 RepID=A0A1Z5HTQ9_9FIRM|nr:OmpA family protein [Calderihabitans maritimus]GAW92926.1 flagellar motor protein [Calderihabitans maritimus]